MHAPSSMLEITRRPQTCNATLRERSDPIDLPQLLAARYSQLEDADRALREAEQRLNTAHFDYARRQGPRPDGLYREIVLLREESRRLLDDLGELFGRQSGGI